MDFELTAEQKQFQRLVHDFVAHEVQPHARHVDETGEFNWAAVRKMGPLGLLGLQVPEDYGGADLDTVCATIAIEELGWACGSTALAVSAHNCLGQGPLVDFAAEELKRRWLPQLATGQGRLGCLSLTEPGAGSDLQGGVRTTAVRRGDEWVIDGAKMWVTNAGVADTIIALCRTDPAGGSRSLSLILVPTATPGVIIGPPEKKMGLNGSPTHAVTFEGVCVPYSNLVGEEGKGLQQTLSTLSKGRVSIGALALGLAQAAYERAVAYARERRTFGQPLAGHQAIQFMLADAATEIQAARLMLYHAAWLKDQGKPFATAAGMAKLFATEMAERVCRNAIQIHGGYGYSREYEVERMYRDTRLMSIGEGTSEIQRMIIARSILGS
jgi:alkylation response protein AidB-like acyl-CoA dehydrogenase